MWTALKKYGQLKMDEFVICKIANFRSLIEKLTSFIFFSKMDTTNRKGDRTMVEMLTSDLVWGEAYKLLNKGETIRVKRYTSEAYLIGKDEYEAIKNDLSEKKMLEKKIEALTAMLKKDFEKKMDDLVESYREELDGKIEESCK